MRTTIRAAALLALAAALPAPARAQGAKLAPYVGLTAGGNGLPDVFQQRCAPGTTYALEGRAGVARGAVALEARGSLLGDVSNEVCVLALDVVPPPDGVRTGVDYPFRGGPTHTSADLRLRLGGTPRLPLALSAGGGWLARERVPYLLAGAGLHAGGRLRLVADAGWHWYRIRSELVTREWKDYRIVREISRERRHGWVSGPGVRLGVELPFRRQP